MLLFNIVWFGPCVYTEGGVKSDKDISLLLPDSNKLNFLDVGDCDINLLRLSVGFNVSWFGVQVIGPVALGLNILAFKPTWPGV